MTMLSKLGGFGAKEESTAGTAETIAAAQMILADEFKVGREPNMQERAVVRDKIDPLVPLKGGTSCPVTGILPLRNGGTAGTVNNPLGDFIESCGFDESVEAGYKVVYTLRADPHGCKSITPKEFRGGSSGKYVTARGVRGNGAFSVKAGEKGVINYDGLGVLEATGDGATVASPADTPKSPVFKSANMWLLEHHAILAEDLDGAVEKLQDGAGSNVKLAITVAQGTTAQKVKKIRLNATKVGTPANETNGLTLTIETDDAGDPSGTPITNGTADTIATAGISDTATWIDFSFSTPPTLDASTTYHIVVTSDYDTDTDNCISFDTDIVAAGAQICQYFDAAWAALSEKNISCQILVAVDPTIYFEGVEINPNNEVALQLDPNGSEGWIYGDIGGRTPKIILTPLEKTDATSDFWSYLTDATDLYLQFQIGTTAGNIIEFIVQHCKVSLAGTWDDRDGKITHPLELVIEDGTDFEIRLR